MAYGWAHTCSLDIVDIVLMDMFRFAVVVDIHSQKALYAALLSMRVSFLLVISMWDMSLGNLCKLVFRTTMMYRKAQKRHGNGYDGTGMVRTLDEALL